MTDQHSDQELDAFGEWERAAWEVRAAPYAASLGDLTRGSIPALLDAAGIGAGTRLLDVGTGPGFVALAAASRGAEVTAADQSTAMVGIARAAGVDAVVASAEALPYDDGSFDAVTAGYLVNHLPRPEAAVAEVARVLRPGGRFALTVWGLPEENPALGLFGPVAASFGLSAAVPPGPDAQRFSCDQAMLALLGTSLAAAAVQRLRWVVTVEPGSWFDAVAASTPRTGAVLAAATDVQRATMRERYVEVSRQRFGAADGRVELPAAAVLGSATRR
jgi:SAM-dependent methyltransferase